LKESGNLKKPKINYLNCKKSCTILVKTELKSYGDAALDAVLFLAPALKFNIFRFSNIKWYRTR
jgi:hypothetical protein